MTPRTLYLHKHESLVLQTLNISVVMNIDHDHVSEGQICILSETFLSYMSGNQLCKVNNGGCSHLCLLTPDGYQCACPDGLPLQPDEKKCLTGNKKINN